MKTFLILIMSLSFTLAAFGQTVIDSGRPAPKEAAEKVDSSYRGFTNKAEAKNLKVNGKKEGKWIEYMLAPGDKTTKDSNKARYYQLAVYKAGKLNGVVRAYEKNGQLHSTVLYFSGKKNGDYKFYDSGQVVLTIPYINDRITGVAMFYPFPGDTDHTGILEIPYVDGKKNGVQKIYYESGKIMCEDTIIDNKKVGTYVAYYESGKILMEVPRANGKPNGWKKCYYEDGKIQSETFYKNGKEGVIKNYDENGNETK